MDIGAFEETSQLLSQVDGLLPNSWLELQSIRSDLHWVGSCFEIAHYGVDPTLFLDADPSSFKEYSGIEKRFVMQAGRIEPAKNQAMLCWALREYDIPIVLVGSSKNWPAYTDLCQKTGNRLRIFPHLPQNAGFSLRFGSCSCAVKLDGNMWTSEPRSALSGTPVVGSTFGHELEYLECDAWYGDLQIPKALKMQY